MLIEIKNFTDTLLIFKIKRLVRNIYLSIKFYGFVCHEPS